MKSFARVVELLLGLFFLVSAGMKALDVEAFAVQISLYGVLKDPGLLIATAYSVIGVETVLGAALLSGRRLGGLPHAGAAGLTAVFTGLIAYAWRFKGLEDCGCFGEYVQMGPGASMLKNLVLIGFLGFAWWGTRGVETDPKARAARLRLRIAVTGSLVVALLAFPTGGDSSPAASAGGSDAGQDTPFGKFSFEWDGARVELGAGTRLVAFLSATCDHCMASVPRLNELHADSTVPQVAGLVLGTESELKSFVAFTSPTFPMQLLAPLEFFSYVDSAPPTLHFVKEGHTQANWEWQDEAPSLEEVRERVAREAP